MKGRKKGFSLIELVVVIGVISMLMAIMVPVVGSVRRHARSVIGINNNKQVVAGVTMFAMDNRDRFPESVATIGVMGGYWNWQEPTMLTGFSSRSPRMHRSMSAYLSEYVEKASMIVCPSAPGEYKYLEEMWRAGDGWNCPETLSKNDPVYGSYCFYWNYIGWLGPGRVFRGPRDTAGGRRQSKLLISDYFGYDHWQSPGALGSCEKFNGVSVTPGTVVSSPYWSQQIDGGVKLDMLDVKLHASFTDGHIESYSAKDVVGMRVSIKDDGSVPYPAGMGPGVIYLPRMGVR